MPKPIYIVGAGPGDPDLITVKGRDLLVAADVVVYANSLIPETILKVCRPDAEIIPTADKTLEEILEILIDRYFGKYSGRSHLKIEKKTEENSQNLIIRLHDGDPCLFGAIHEQIVGLTAANIPVEIIPGVSAFQLAAARLGTELTIPELVQTIILTRMGDRVPEDLARLAAHQASLCLYLSARYVVDAQAKLLEHYPADTTVAICFRLGWQDEKILTVPLTEMAAATKSANLTRTTLYVISPALGLKNLTQRSEGRSQLYNSQHQHLFRGE